jgi:hypothetical protein
MRTVQYEIWDGKPERKRPLRRRKDNIKIDIKEEGMGAWTRFMKRVQAFVNTVMNLWICRRQRI